MRDYLYSPFHLVFLFIYFLFFLFFSIFFFLGIPFAFAQLGIPPGVAIFLFWLALIGSLINIPIGTLHSSVPVIKYQEVRFWGIIYRVPYTSYEKTVLAINFGGAIIPIVISILVFSSLLVHHQFSLILKGLVGILIVTLAAYSLARPVKGIGIAMPALLPPLISALVAIFIAPENPVPVAYVSGTLGTLIGADLLHMKDIEKLGAPIASIGGAGTFDGIFLSGIIAVLLVFMV